MNILIRFFAQCRFYVLLICSAQLLSAQDPPAPGSVDWTFEHKLNGGYPISILVQPDGRLLVGGGVYIPGPRSVVCRLSCDGSYDPTFAPPADSFWTYFSAMALQSDGKVLVASFSDHYGAGVDRFNSDGSLDASFLGLELPSDPCYGFFWATALVFQPDGKLLGSGRRRVVAECSGDDPYWDDPTLYRWLPNGALDSSFVPNGLYAAETFILLTNNQILVNRGGGSLSRLHPDGTHDTNFVAGPFSDAIECLAIQPDGRILVGGYFTNVQGQACFHIARLLPDGRLDTSFNPPAIRAQWDAPVVKGIAIQTDGRILIGGVFDTIDGLAYGSLARLNSDGTLDPSFLPWENMDDGVRTIVFQDETKALIGGGFGDDYPTGDLFRIHLGEPAPRLSIYHESGGLLQLNFPYSGSYDFAVACATNLTLPASNWTVLGSATNAGAGLYRFTDRVEPAATQRFYQLQRPGTP